MTTDKLNASNMTLEEMAKCCNMTVEEFKSNVGRELGNTVGKYKMTSIVNDENDIVADVVRQGNSTYLYDHLRKKVHYISPMGFEDTENSYAWSMEWLARGMFQANKLWDTDYKLDETDIKDLDFMKRYFSHWERDWEI